MTATDNLTTGASAATECGDMVRGEFRKLPTAVRTALIRAASQDDAVYELLETGMWGALTNRLRELRINPDIITTFECGTPNFLARY